MAKNKDNLLTMIDADGKEVLCEILFTYHSDEFNKDYVVFFVKGSDNSDDEQIEVNAAIYNPENKDGGSLLPVETDEEWEMLENLLEEFEEDEDDADQQEEFEEDEFYADQQEEIEDN